MESVATGCLSVVVWLCGCGVAIGVAVMVLDGGCRARTQFVDAFVFVVVLLIGYGVVWLVSCVACVGVGAWCLVGGMPAVLEFVVEVAEDESERMEEKEVEEQAF